MMNVMGMTAIGFLVCLAVAKVGDMVASLFLPESYRTSRKK